MTNDVTTNIIIIFLQVYFIVVKGVALWRAAREHQRNWFIAILLLTELTLGILPLIYLFRFSKKQLTIAEVRGWFFKER